MPRHPLLRTTIVQAFARTIVDDSRRTNLRSAAGELPDESAPPPSMSSLPGVGQVIGGQYRLIEMLGQGMFGRVFVARREDVPEHRVALKLMARAMYAGRNVERELVMLATVGHPNVVQLKDHGTTAEYVWLTMPVYHGETLAQRLERGPLGLREAHDIFVPIARGLEALHAAGLRHQDVKPENIYLATFGGRVHPIILDLGVAAEKEALFVAGTALYGAPEQVAALSGAVPGIIPLGEKMDTYGLGSTLLVALVGPERFPGEKARDRQEFAHAHATRAEEPIGPGALPELAGQARALLQQAFGRWLALDPDERPTMSEVAEQLDVLLEPEREEAREEARKRARQRATIQRFKIAAGAVLLLAGAGAAVMFSKRETLRVASELESARRQGSESFDKLETCAASHRMATVQASSCREARDKDQAGFKAALEDLTRNGSEAEAGRARQLSGYAAKARACEDSAVAAKRVCADEEAKLREGGDKQRAALAAIAMERDLARGELVDTKRRQAELEKRVAELEGERKSCAEDRDSCRAAAAKLATAVLGHGASASPASPANPANPAPPEGATTATAPPAVSAATPASVAPLGAQ